MILFPTELLCFIQAKDLINSDYVKCLITPNWIVLSLVVRAK